MARLSDIHTPSVVLIHDSVLCVRFLFVCLFLFLLSVLLPLGLTLFYFQVNFQYKYNKFISIKLHYVNPNYLLNFKNTHSVISDNINSKYKMKKELRKIFLPECQLPLAL